MVNRNTKYPFPTILHKIGINGITLTNPTLCLKTLLEGIKPVAVVEDNQSELRQLTQNAELTFH